MISAAIARTHLGLESSADADLLVLIGGATAYLGHALNRYLGPPVSRVELKDGLGTNAVYLDEPETAAPELEMTIETRAGRFEVWEVLSAVDWALEPPRRVVGRSAWPKGSSNVRIVYDAGYATDQGPAELRSLVLELVALRWNARGEDGAKLSETIGDYSYRNGTLEGLASWEAVASSWRRLPL